jgi:hypothetical protein
VPHGRIQGIQKVEEPWIEVVDRPCPVVAQEIIELLKRCRHVVVAATVDHIQAFIRMGVKQAQAVHRFKRRRIVAGCWKSRATKDKHKSYDDCSKHRKNSLAQQIRGVAQGFALSLMKFFP